MKKLFIWVLLLGTVAVGAVGFWSWQKNAISKEELKLEIIAPEKIAMAEEVTYVVKYKNNGETNLEKATLIFEYPTGSLPIDQEQRRIIKEIGDIYPGQEQSLRFSARLFGKEGEVKEAKAQLSYTPKNLNAAFRSETSASTILSSSPLNFGLDTPSRMESGQTFEFALNYFSNSEYPLTDLRIKMAYPVGYQFQSASPTPVGSEEWKIGVLNKGEGGRITIKGKLEGQVQEVKIFKATIGSWKEGEFTVLGEINRGIEITKPKLLVSQMINGGQPSSVSPGETLHYEILFRNASDRNLENLFLIVNLDGRPFDLDTVRVEKGKFQKGDTSLLWEARDVPKLRFLGRGEEGRVEFWVNVRQEWETFSPEDTNFTLRNRVLLSDVSEEFEVKVNAKVTIDQAAYFQDEVFGNQGPMPPRVGDSTTYTVIWQVKNSYNDVRNVKVKATLPSWVSLAGRMFPENSAFTFDSQSRELVWDVGDAKAGTGTHNPVISLAFQIRFTPDFSQRGTAPQLIGEVRITGDDAFTERSLSSADSPLDTNLPDDASSAGKGIVQ